MSINQINALCTALHIEPSRLFEDGFESFRLSNAKLIDLCALLSNEQAKPSLKEAQIMLQTFIIEFKIFFLYASN